MINLMPPAVKQERSYGRKNIKMLRWAIQSVFAFTILNLTMILGLITIHNSQQTATDSKNSIQQKIKDENLDQTQKAYTEFSTNLNTVTQILSKQIIYSLLLQKIGSVIPPGATLNSISISSADNALDLNFKINSSSLAPIIQINLQDERNKLFEKADIIQVNCQQGQASDSCTAQLKAQYKKDAIFLFINTIGASK